MRDRENSDGFFLLLLSQGKEEQRQTQRGRRIKTDTRKKEYLEKANIIQMLDRNDNIKSGASASGSRVPCFMHGVDLKHTCFV